MMSILGGCWSQTSKASEGEIDRRMKERTVSLDRCEKSKTMMRERTGSPIMKIKSVGSVTLLLMYSWTPLIFDVQRRREGRRNVSFSANSSELRQPFSLVRAHLDLPRLPPTGFYPPVDQDRFVIIQKRRQQSLAELWCAVSCRKEEVKLGRRGGVG